MKALRLLPWSDDKRAYLRTDDSESRLSQLADEMEEAQLKAGSHVLGAARDLLGDPKASTAELRFAAARLSECLFDALRVAESRGVLLADIDDEDRGSEADTDKCTKEDGRT
ncbi:hypothetical protein [Streptomyces sp. JW3]|uniref:hypothetical protein n=1 Tax=Streptomyces sp. JW3 TaxID=3456955 RepID=UPI003FA4C47C